MAEKITLEKKDLFPVILRSYQALGGYTYDKQQGAQYMRAMIPALQKLYPNKEKLAEALARHNTTFNTTVACIPFCLGISCAMEEEYANDETGNVDPAAIGAVKIALMGPLAGIGDSLFWGTFRLIACGIGAPLAASGNLLGVILYLLINLIPTTVTRYFGFWIGFNGGREFMAKMQANGTLSKLTEAAKVLAMMVIGGMIPQIVRVPISFTLEMGGGTFVLKDVIDGIMPNLLPLLLSIYVYRLIRKGTSVNKIMICMFVIGIALTVIGIM